MNYYDAFQRTLRMLQNVGKDKNNIVRIEGDIDNILLSVAHIL